MPVICAPLNRVLFIRELVATTLESSSSTSDGLYLRPFMKSDPVWSSQSSAAPWTSMREVNFFLAAGSTDLNRLRVSNLLGSYMIVKMFLLLCLYLVSGMGDLGVV